MFSSSSLPPPSVTSSCFTLSSCFLTTALHWKVNFICLKKIGWVGGCYQFHLLPLSQSLHTVKQRLSLNVVFWSLWLICSLFICFFCNLLSSWLQIFLSDLRSIWSDSIRIFLPPLVRLNRRPSPRGSYSQSRTCRTWEEESASGFERMWGRFFVNLWKFFTIYYLDYFENPAEAFKFATDKIPDQFNSRPSVNKEPGKRS